MSKWTNPPGKIVGICAISGTTIVATDQGIYAQDWIQPGVWVPFEGVGADHMLIRNGKIATREQTQAVLDKQYIEAGYGTKEEA
jgi:hypothetical protein